MSIPYRSDEEIEQIASDFSLRCHPGGIKERPIVPTPIKLVVEQQLRLEIVIFRGYLDRFYIDGSISTDLTNITVDEHVFDRLPNRYHFTLAHEVGHLVLHSAIIQELAAESAVRWREQRLNVPEGVHRRMEIQASQFAAHILVPANQLASTLEDARAMLTGAAQGLIPEELTTSSLSSPAGWIVKQFEVSTSVVEIRMRNL